MSVEPRIALALGASAWESTLVAGLAADQRIGQRRVRRCVDVVDLLAEVGAGLIDVVIVDAEFPRLDATAIGRLLSGAHEVIGLSATEVGDARLRQLGVGRVIGVEPSAPGEVIRELLAVVCQADEASNPGQVPAAHDASPGPLPVAGQPGAIVTVWGPAGAPGRTTVALALAERAAARGLDALLVDADTGAAGVADALGMSMEGSGLIAACRHAEQGTLDTAALVRLCRTVGQGYRVLTGIPAGHRRAELRPAALKTLWDIATVMSPVVVVDVADATPAAAGSAGFPSLVGAPGIGDSEEFAPIDTLVPRSEVIVAVTGCEPGSLARFLSGLTAVAEANPAAELDVVINRVRGTVLKSAQLAEIRTFLLENEAVRHVYAVPDDRPAFDAAAGRGRTIGEHAPKSPAARALTELAEGTLSCIGVRQAADSVA